MATKVRALGNKKVEPPSIPRLEIDALSRSLSLQRRVFDNGVGVLDAGRMKQALLADTSPVKLAHELATNGGEAIQLWLARDRELCTIKIDGAGECVAHLLAAYGTDLVQKALLKQSDETLGITGRNGEASVASILYDRAKTMQIKNAIGLRLGKPENQIPLRGPAS